MNLTVTVGTTILTLRVSAPDISSLGRFVLVPCYRLCFVIRTIAKLTIIKARDVIFNEDEVFNGNLERLKDDVRDIPLPESAELLMKTNITQEGQILGSNSESEELSPEEDTILLGNPLSVEESVEDINIEEDLDQDQISAIPETKKNLAGTEEFAYPTPLETPLAALLSATIKISDDLDTLANNLLGEESKQVDSEFRPWNASFLAGQRQSCR
ncbi:hypothetical protein TSTA_111680 [Talaromyces stipitatus ATCC 10500]|uniref:Uncharacterized protein n=1 Tax=Talaromyces stipitatus (strain ATCC 10500 / CBS 375.48 / QM 6759 / NRRL 1006) TaxID=441959 RepID=B8M937_TALSN|nr:uncharacterized protein TSTA_111680 [Talaromyces stipitatus ATCC 10500]EED17332.1 hypothetical protein TSTA_111680 [Talaromyces stipitatus ATCC 10500]